MTWDLAGIGNALVDALVVVDDDAVLQELGLVRGTMHLVDHEQWMAAYEHVRKHKVAFDSGGSGANSLATAGLLGARALYCGQVGDDQMGHMYAKKIEEACGAHALRFTGDRATGKCLAIISATDAERTMLTDLGAATELPALGDFEHALRTAKITHFTGYELLGGPMRDVVLKAMQVVSESGNRVSFDAADPFVVVAIRDLVWQVLQDHADIVFLNAEEARALTDDAPEQAIHTIARKADIRTVVVKLGGRGSLVLHDGELHEIAVRRVKAVDTTGAGDAYAGGFLYGVLQGWNAGECGRLASAVASLTVSQVGAVVKDRVALAALLDEVRTQHAAGARA
jgi:sugar/nucleoside kinase (ribokinase family)